MTEPLTYPINENGTIIGGATIYSREECLVALLDGVPTLVVFRDMTDAEIAAWKSAHGFKVVPAERS